MIPHAMRRPGHLLGLTLIALFLTACVTAPPPPDDSYSHQTPRDWNERKAALTDFNHWQLQGKVALRHNERTDTGVIGDWHQQGEAFRLSVSSSFMGMGRTQIEGSPDNILLTLANGERYQSHDPDALVEEALGWPLPVHALSYWVRGLPAPGADAWLYFDDDGTLGYVRQSGWLVYFERHAPLAENSDLIMPRRITAHRDDTRIRLVVTQWTPDN